MLRKFETLVLLKSDSPHEKTEAALNKINSVITDNGGSVLVADNWGKKKLAYEVQKQNKGIYVLYSFLAEGNLIHELERNFRINQEIMKFLTLKIDDNVDVEGELTRARETREAKEKEEEERAARALAEQKVLDDIQKEQQEAAKKEVLAEQAKRELAENQEPEVEPEPSPEEPVAEEKEEKEPEPETETEPEVEAVPDVEVEIPIELDVEPEPEPEKAPEAEPEKEETEETSDDNEEKTE